MYFCRPIIIYETLRKRLYIKPVLSEEQVGETVKKHEDFSNLKVVRLLVKKIGV